MKQKTVLMVEDDGAIAVILHAMLVGLDYSVTGPVATWEAAIAAEQQHFWKGNLTGDN